MVDSFRNGCFPGNPVSDRGLGAPTEKNTSQVLIIGLAFVSRPAEAFVHDCPVLGIFDGFSDYVQGKDGILQASGFIKGKVEIKRIGLGKVLLGIIHQNQFFQQSSQQGDFYAPGGGTHDAGEQPGVPAPVVPGGGKAFPQGTFFSETDNIYYIVILNLSSSRRFPRNSSPNSYKTGFQTVLTPEVP